MSQDEPTYSNFKWKKVSSQKSVIKVLDNYQIDFLLLQDVNNNYFSQKTVTTCSSLLGLGPSHVRTPSGDSRYLPKVLYLNLRHVKRFSVT